MNKTNKWLLAIVAALIVIIAVLVAVFWLPNNLLKPNYYAVYLDTGDLYFGKLSHFPHLSLSNVWYLQRDSQGTSLTEFVKAPWGPEDKIEINRDRVVWTAKLSDLSQLIPYIENKVPEISNQNGVQIPENIATSTQ